MESVKQLVGEPYRRLEDFSLWDLEVVRLIITGGTVLDWYRLGLGAEEAKAFLRAHRLDLDRAEDAALVGRIRDEAVVYLRETFDFPIPRPVRHASFLELVEMAGDTSNRHRRMCACTVLKAMHIINHFDASEARQALAMTDQELFQAAERRIYKLMSQMMAHKLPVAEFMGGRKRKASMVTKLLSKSSPLSAQLFDKMRFRIITNTIDDIFPVMAYLMANLFPFNYVVAGESYNTLIPFLQYCRCDPHLSGLVERLQLSPSDEAQAAGQSLTNRHSSPDYRVAHWVADMPLRIPNYESVFVTDGINPIPRPIVYVRTEIQILDRPTHRRNERGPASHEAYKQRQLRAVASRLKVGLGQRGPVSNLA